MARLKFGAFLAPHHPIGEHPMLQFRRDLDFVQQLDELGYDEFWCGEHHSSGWEMIASPEMFLADARTALAGVILFDQFPRNMFRGDAEQYSTDLLAQSIARGAVDRRLDDELDRNGRIFLYMPFMHSEGMDDQRRSVLLFTALGEAEQLKYAKHHHDIVERYGRFPHRNAMLGRASRPDEIASGADKPW